MTDFILVAGPNGCGKSCVLDAIRLLKSAYGGYSHDEWMQWFGEFQINLNDRDDLQRMFRDKNSAVVVRASVQLTTEEKDFLRERAEIVLEPLVWEDVTGQPIDNYNFSATTIAAQFRQHGTEVATELARRAEDMRNTLGGDSYELRLTVTPTPRLIVEPHPTMEAVFRTFDPQHLGIVDYHSAARNYVRENLGGVNLNVQNLESQRRTQSLYNIQAKYQNIKTELATTYIRDLIAREAGEPGGESDLGETLRELFQTFFPDKEYLGVSPNPTGGLNFPVRLSTGEVHDINELSSGEKEVLYGYLRLRNATPRNSAILLDEPELHLNPALLRGFPDFYHKNIGRAKGNQMWLVTHSDTLLRQAVGNPNYSVYHMTTAASIAADGNQALEVVADDELDAATIDLVGDLATYRPNAKVVILEGGGDVDFDVSAVERLFPDFAKRVNLASGGDKRRVRDLYDLLESMAERVNLGKRFYAIVDRDAEPTQVPTKNARSLSWDVYHIENYLLVPEYLRKSLAALTGKTVFQNDDEVVAALRQSAMELVPALILERLRKHVNAEIVSRLNFGADPNSADPPRALLPSIEGSLRRVQEVGSSLGDLAHLRTVSETIKQELHASLDGETWIKDFPGREILRRFVGGHVEGKGNYEGFRNLLISQMVDGKYQPEGMRTVLESVLAEDPSSGSSV